VSLDNIGFSVSKGETVGIIGRNGAGKSTLLQIICGTLAPTQGSVEVNGKVAALLELGAGFNPEFTGRENVYMNASILGLTEEQIDDRYESIVEFADIGDYLDQPVKTYSSGMYVRLAFAVIAHVDAEILVIDEALAVGDVFFTQKCMRFLRQFMKTGTVLFVSHDSASIQNLCDRAVLLEDGSVSAEGSAKEVTERYLEMLFDEAEGIEPKSDKKVSGETDESTLGDKGLEEKLVKIAEKEERVDCREKYINESILRNDIKIDWLNEPQQGFGEGGANIEKVVVETLEGQPIAWLVGGDRAVLKIWVKTNCHIENMIVGFYVNDKLGQRLFGDNTFLKFISSPRTFEAEQLALAEFEFDFPVLPQGDYTVTVAVAEGSTQEHVQHHWIHDALALKSVSSRVSNGLIGIPMYNISLNVQ
jgi:lipopolysaccharide transport system ATP-binding protein